ncbi:MAG: ankyrin repeat domain-containing protein, partial [Parachlamydia sp.]|nr:ankyrin repeat domain-containing protein [Parachlamydia sp.]
MQPVPAPQASPAVSPSQGTSQRGNPAGEINAADAIQTCFRALEDTGTAPQSVYQSLLKVIPSMTPRDYLDLLSLLPPFLSRTTGFFDEQRRLALALAEWKIRQAEQGPLEEHFSNYQGAMSYYSTAIQIAKIMEERRQGEHVREDQRAASKLLMRILCQHLLQNHLFKNRLERARSQGKTAEEMALKVMALIESIETFQRFCSDEQDRQHLFALYEIAFDECHINCPESRRSMFAEHRNLIQVKQRQIAQAPQVLELRTAEYHRALAKFREAFDGSPKSPQPIRSSREHMNYFSEEVMSYQMRVTRKFKEFFSILLQDAVTILGPPPCQYDICAMGSLGRMEPCPYSDLEFMILVENEACEGYFQFLAQLLHLQILSLGETASTDLIFTCLGEKNRSGLHVDFAGHLTDIVGTPQKIASKQCVDVLTAKDPNSFAHTALKSCSLTAEASPLYTAYLNEIDQILNRLRPDGTKESHFRSLELVKTRCNDIDKGWAKPDFENELSLKERYVWFIHYLLADLSMLWGIQKTNTLEILDQIPQTVLTDRSKALLKEAAAIIYTLRLALHRAYRQQKEEGYPVGRQPGGELAPGGIAPEDWERLKQYYHLILRPLYCFIAPFVNQPNARLDQIFHQLDLLELGFERAWRNPDAFSSSTLTYISAYLKKIPAPLVEHVAHFKILFEQPDKQLCRAYLQGLSDPRLQLLLEQLGAIVIPPNAAEKWLAFIEAIELLDLSQVQHQEQFLCELFKRIPEVENLTLHFCDLNGPQIRKALSGATHLKKLHIPRSTALQVENFLEILNQFPALHLILGNSNLTKKQYVSLFRFAWDRQKTISLFLKDQPVPIAKESLNQYLIPALEIDERFLAETLIRLGANLHQIDSQGRSLIHQFARQANSGLEIIIRHGLFSNDKSKENYTPLHYAAAAGIPRNIELLIRRGARVDETNTERDKVTPLHRAIRSNQASAVSCLLSHNANMLACTSESQNAFHIAAEYGLVDILNILIQRARTLNLDLTACLNARDHDGKTPLHYAVRGEPKPQLAR